MEHFSNIPTSIKKDINCYLDTSTTINFDNIFTNCQSVISNHCPSPISQYISSSASSLLTAIKIDCLCSYYLESLPRTPISNFQPLRKLYNDLCSNKEKILYPTYADKLNDIRKASDSLIYRLIFENKLAYYEPSPKPTKCKYLYNPSHAETLNFLLCGKTSKLHLQLEHNKINNYLDFIIDLLNHSSNPLPLFYLIEQNSSLSLYLCLITDCYISIQNSLKTESLEYISIIDNKQSNCLLSLKNCLLKAIPYIMQASPYLKQYYFKNTNISFFNLEEKLFTIPALASAFLYSLTVLENKFNTSTLQTHMKKYLHDYESMNNVHKSIEQYLKIKKIDKHLLTNITRLVFDFISLADSVLYTPALNNIDLESLDLMLHLHSETFKLHESINELKLFISSSIERKIKSYIFPDLFNAAIPHI